MSNSSSAADTTAEGAASTTKAPAKSAGGFLAWFGGLIGIADEATVITVLVFICLGIALVVILIIVTVCVCKKLRSNAKKQRRPQMRGVFKDEVPGSGEMCADITGLFEFALEYDMKKKELKVTIIQASDLVPPNSSSSCDPYCKFYLAELRNEKEEETDDHKLEGSPAPKKMSKVYKTSYKDDTCNPTWSESFNIPLAYDNLEKAVLTFEVFDYDTVGHDIKLGLLEIPMNTLELSNFLNRRMEMSGRLLKTETEYTGLGDVCVILRQSPDDEQLHVTILEAKRLRFDPEKFPNAPDVLVSVTLLLNKKRLSNKKTSWRKNTRNPYFSETMIFPIKPAKLNLASVTCSLKYKNMAGLRKTLGRINLGSQAETVGGQKHWQEMLDQPRRAIAMWHSMLKVDRSQSGDED